VRRAGWGREDVEVWCCVGVVVWVADGEEEVRRFGGGVFFAGDVEGDFYPEFRLGDVCCFTP
jgi:hypothetical protein